jgi:hypothetical protein
VHVAPACAGPGKALTILGLMYTNLSLQFCKRLFPGLELMTSWSQGNSFTAAKLSYFSKYVGTVAWVCIVLWLFQ